MHPEEGPTDVKRPAFQWYPGDFRRDTALQACSFEARAIWREMLDLMHDGEPYGHLTAGGAPMNETHVARIAGVSVAKARKWIAELEAHRVFSRTEAGVIYSRRMVKDEHIRTVRAASGRLGGNPNLVNQTDNQSPTPASASAFASAENTDPDASRDRLTQLAVWTNSAIAEHWGEQAHPLRRDQFGPLDAAVAHIDGAVVRASLYAQCRGSKNEKPPKHPNYFRAGILEAWEQESTRRVVANSGETPPAIRVARVHGLRPSPAEQQYANIMGTKR